MLTKGAPGLTMLISVFDWFAMQVKSIKGHCENYDNVSMDKVVLTLGIKTDKGSSLCKQSESQSRSNSQVNHRMFVQVGICLTSWFLF